MTALSNYFTRLIRAFHVSYSSLKNKVTLHHGRGASDSASGAVYTGPPGLKSMLGLANFK